jgi:hypothetical protein
MTHVCGPLPLHCSALALVIAACVDQRLLSSACHRLVDIAIFTTVSFVIAGVVLQKQVHERFVSMPGSKHGFSNSADALCNNCLTPTLYATLNLMSVVQRWQPVGSCGHISSLSCPSPGSRQDVNTTAFRWMYFIAAILPFWLIIDLL